MDRLESEFLKSQEFNPMLWYRYMDVIFFIWTYGEVKFESYLDELNKYRLNIKVKHEFNKESILLLDLEVNKNLTTEIFIKATDRHQYFQYPSLHPEHTKRSNLHSLALRLSNKCSDEKSFVKKFWFLNRGHP